MPYVTRSGRADSGRFRNFTQMSDDKLDRVLSDIKTENNDILALTTAQTEWEKRYPPQGIILNLAEELKTLDKQRVDFAKEALNTTLSEVFKNLNIESISWGQKYTEYNDEGMYDGVSGPVVNVNFEGLERHEWQDKVCYHPDPVPIGCAKEVKALSEVLNAIGPRTLCDIVGDDEYVVTATREKPVYSYKLTSEYAGY